MDIGKLKNNISYYEGYEGEPEVVVALKGAEDITLHIWNGLPFRPAIPAKRPLSLDEMTKEGFDAKMARGWHRQRPVKVFLQMIFSHRSDRRFWMSTHKKYNVVVLPEAQQDIREIVLYIVRELAAPQAVLDLEDDFAKEILSLANMPERIRIVDEEPWRESEVRKIRVKNYYIYFVIDAEETAVKILAVIYVGSDQEKQMEERDVK